MDNTLITTPVAGTLGPHINTTGVSDRLQFGSVSGIRTLTIWYKLHSADVITNDDYTNCVLFDSRSGNAHNVFTLTSSGPHNDGTMDGLRGAYYTISTGSDGTVKNGTLYINNEKFINEDGGTTIKSRNNTDLLALSSKLYLTRANVWTCATFVMASNVNDDISIFGQHNSNSHGLKDVEIGPVLMYDRQLTEPRGIKEL